MIHLFHKNDIRRLGEYTDLPWTRLGCTPGHISDRLSVDRKFSVAEEIRSVVGQVRKNFVDFVGQLARQQPDKVLWYASPLASKSVSQTDIFHQYVYLKVLERIAERQGEQVVITDNDSFYYHVDRIAPADVHMCSECPSLRAITGPAWRGVLKLARYALLWLVLRLAGSKNIPDTDCLLHMWIDDRIYQNSPDRHDPYFGDLASHLHGNGIRVTRIGPVSLDFRQARRIRSTFPGLILPLAHVKWSRLWRCLTVRFTVRMMPEKFEGIEDISILLYLTGHEVYREQRVRACLPYLLYYYGYVGVSEKLPRPVAFIFPYENQPWEKMLNFACPRFRRIGYQHSTIPVNWLDYYCSDIENAEPRPDMVLTSGARWTKFLKASNKYLNVAEAGTFRYRYLLETETQRPQKIQGADILVVLPIDPNNALQVQEMIIGLLEKPAYNRYRFLIKPHPHLSTRFARSQRLAGYSNCILVNDPVGELLRRCRLCISVDSTVAIEAVIAGVPTLNIVPEELTQGMEDLITGYSFTATEANFEGVFNEVVQAETAPEVSVESFFSPVQYRLFLEQVKCRGTNQPAGAS